MSECGERKGAKKKWTESGYIGRRERESGRREEERGEIERNRERDND